MATVTTEKLTYGIKNVYAAKITNTDGVITYGTPKAITGATEITLSAAGEEVKIHADDAVYFVTSVNGGYTGNLNTYTLPDWFYTDFLGYIADANGVLVESEGAPKADFALIFEFATESAKTKRNVLYNVSASRPEVSSKTKENTIDPQPLSVPLTASPAIDTGYIKASIVGDSTDTTWAGWLSEVYVS